MHTRFRQLSQQIQTIRRFSSSLYTNANLFNSPKKLVLPRPPFRLLYHHHFNSTSYSTNPSLATDPEALEIQTLLKIHSHSSIQEIEQHFDQCCNISLSQDLVLNVLKRHRSDWKPAYAFFNWVSHTESASGFYPTIDIFNEMLDVLGRMKRFDELRQLFDEMCSRENFVNVDTYRIVVSRYASGHKVEEAVRIFDKIEDFGLDRDLFAFQTLLLSLCRYKHVEEAELLFRNMRSEFRDDIKTWNIILNGWCLLRSLPDAKRFWKDIVASTCKPDKYTYGIFINSLEKSGKISTALGLLRTMWEKGCKPDATICNNVINGLCFKKRIPEALQLFHEMNERDCAPNVATYNSLIKHLCKIERMEKVHELLNEMEDKGESCSPNCLTYSYLLNCAKKTEEVDKILDRMMKRGCKMDGDNYNLILRLFMQWGDLEKVKHTWDEMERSGLGPDRRTYTICVHGLYDQGMMVDALKYYAEMMSKGLVPEPRTELLVDDMKSKLKENEGVSKTGLRKRKVSLNFSRKQGKKQ